MLQLTIPGAWVVDEDAQWAWETQSRLFGVKSLFVEASAALALFERLNEQQLAILLRDLEVQRAEKRWLSHMHLPDLQGPKPWSLEPGAEARDRAERRARGELPESVLHQQALIAAQAFISALATLWRLLDAVSKEPRPIEGAARARDAISTALPDLKDVRDAVQHYEDRIRGLVGRPGRQRVLDPLPVDTGGLRVAGGVTLVGHMEGSSFFCTKPNGAVGCVEVSAAKLDVVHAALVELLAQQRWRGRPLTYPADL